MTDDDVTTREGLVRLTKITLELINTLRGLNPTVRMQDKRITFLEDTLLDKPGGKDE